MTRPATRVERLRIGEELLVAGQSIVVLNSYNRIVNISPSGETEVLGTLA